MANLDWADDIGQKIAKWSFNDSLWHQSEGALAERIASALREEREACAQIAEICDQKEGGPYGLGVHAACAWVAAAIRARSEKS